MWWSMRDGARTARVKAAHSVCRSAARHSNRTEGWYSKPE
jgi:hypothetical protein